MDDQQGRIDWLEGGLQALLRIEEVCRRAEENLVAGEVLKILDSALAA